MSATQKTAPEPSRSTGGVAVLPVAAPQDPAPAGKTVSEAEKREALIRIAAYSFYERRGYVSGHELEDWLQAEMEVDRQMGGAPLSRQTD
ncbi:MAG: DUF2934 domain-containing protein [Rubrivivax sp.]|nr:DUF2934 domain-containing protein [Rubrivivax sp.]